jgi:hypothetical protein
VDSIDLKFPHHTNEIAQCGEALRAAPAAIANCRPFGASCGLAESAEGVDHWCDAFAHSGHLTLKDEKMSKSLGNTVSIRNFLASRSSDELRMLCLLSPYRHPYDDRPPGWNKSPSHTGTSSLLTPIPLALVPKVELDRRAPGKGGRRTAKACWIRRTRGAASAPLFSRLPGT